MTWSFPPPAPAPPKIYVYLTPGAGKVAVDIASYLSQESGAVLTSTIEDPTGTNNFTAADLTLKGYDPTGYIQGLFASITPTSTDFSILINIGIPGTDGGVLAYSFDVLFQGFVSPVTLQFNPKDFSFSFTVIGQAANLQTTSASGLLPRPGYSDSKWKLYQDATSLNKANPSIEIYNATSNLTCDFLAGDVIRVGGNEQFTVVGVTQDTSAFPPAYWSLYLDKAPSAKGGYTVGTSVVLLTPYARNMPLHDVVAALFAAAGFPSEGYFNSPALPNLGALFATPINMGGLPNGPVTGISPGIPGVTQAILAGTPGGLYQSTGPTSPFTFLVNYKLPPVDPTNTLTSYVYTGPKRTQTRVSNPRFGLNMTMKFYAYDWFKYGGTNNRYILTVTVNEDTSNTVYTFSTKLEWETYVIDSWGGTTLLWTGPSSTTLTPLTEAYDAIGIDVDSATGTCFFTDIDVAVAGAPVTMNTSAYQPTGATIATGTIHRNMATGINGQTVCIAPSTIAVFQADGILGNQPYLYVYLVAANGGMTTISNALISPYIVGRSVKKNFGDGRWYALVSDPVNGVTLTSFPAGSAPDYFILPPATSGVPYDVDLICLPTVGGPGSGRYPMIGLIGGTPYYISDQGSGLIPYVDLSDLSVADALQQLTILNAGIFYVAGFGWVFRSRSSPMPGNTIGISDQIDDQPGLISLTTQNVFNRWVGYVRMENENDATIFGEAGSTAFADTGQGITLKSRFVSTASFARALAQSLYNYIGTQKRWIELERFRDGRVYEVGRTFHCNVDGLNRNFQIIETGHPVTGMTVKVVGLEV